MLDHIVYDVNTVDFSPIYNKIIKTNPDFIYIISSVKCVVPTSQYVKMQVPIPITGINVAAVGVKSIWKDTGRHGRRHVHLDATADHWEWIWTRVPKNLSKSIRLSIRSGRYFLTLMDLTPITVYTMPSMLPSAPVGSNPWMPG